MSKKDLKNENIVGCDVEKEMKFLEEFLKNTKNQMKDCNNLRKKWKKVRKICPKIILSCIPLFPIFFIPSNFITLVLGNLAVIGFSLSSVAVILAVIESKRITKELAGYQNQYKVIKEKLKEKKEFQETLKSTIKQEHSNELENEKDILNRIKVLLTLSYELGLKKAKDKYLAIDSIMKEYQSVLSTKEIKTCIDITLGLGKSK